ncbi:MAG: DUF6250 domain-containing protein [Planctomycetota bacterium]
MATINVRWNRLSAWPVFLSMLATGLIGMRPDTGQAADDVAPKPVVLAAGEDLFKIGPLLHEDRFENLDRWSVQVESTDADVPEARIRAADHKLDAFVPGRGATIWFKPKLEGAVAIVYQVRCPKSPETPGVVPRDVNNFWHMSAKPDALLRRNRFTGGFGSYHELQGYYSSTGGRDNTTTRFRRYPREAKGRPADHIALDHRDHQEPYLITPGKTHTVQLVAFDGMAQYIVDGQLVYQIAYGDTVRVKHVDNGETRFSKVVYTRERFPGYTEGWFGFRMTTTHHVYSNFRVYRLNPVSSQ